MTDKVNKVHIIYYTLQILFKILSLEKFKKYFLKVLEIYKLACCDLAIGE